MSILTRLRSAFKALSGEQLVVQPYYKSVSFSQFTQEERAADLLKHFVHWVYICVTKNAAASAAVPLRLYVTTAPDEQQYKYLRKGIDTRSLNKRQYKELAGNPLTSLRLSKALDLEEVVDHPLLGLWNSVNPFMNGFEMVKYIVHYLSLTGDAYLYKARDSFSAPRELWVLPSQFMRVVPDKKDFIKGYLYGSSLQNAKALTPDEVIHFKFTNPHNIFTGFSPVQGGMSAVKRKEDMDAYEHSLLTNNARPDFLIIAKKKMSGTDKKALREQWQQLYGSKVGRGRPAVLDTDATVQTLGFSPKDMGYIHGQKFTKEEIAGVFGVPVSKLVPDAKYANAESGDREWKADTIRPLLTLISDKLNEDLVPGFDGRLFVAFDNPVPEDKEFAFKKQESYLKSSVITINEVRESEGLDDVSWGQVPLVPMSVYPLGTVPEPVVPETEPVEEPDDENEDELKGKRVIKVQRPPQPKIHEMRRLMRRIFTGIEKEVLANLQNKSIQKATLEETFYFMFDTNSWILETAELMGPPIKSTLVTGGQYGLDRLGMGMRFDVLNPEVQRWLETYVAQFSDKVMQTAAADLSKTLLAGIQDGETIFELRKRTETVMGQMKLHKSEMIARSESSRASHQGMIRGWKDSGVVTAKVWRTQSGACQFCAPMEGKVVEIDKSFFEQGSVVQGRDGGNMTLNYDVVDGPPLHPNCSCTLTAEIQE